MRTNDDGDLVVTKGDKYDVREKEPAPGDAAARPVRNLGKPVEVAARYYEEGADEVAFLNITAFREEPLDDVPMLAVLESASERVFVPLTVRDALSRSAGVTQPAHHSAVTHCVRHVCRSAVAFARTRMRKGEDTLRWMWRRATSVLARTRFPLARMRCWLRKHTTRAARRVTGRPPLSRLRACTAVKPWSCLSTRAACT